MGIILLIFSLCRLLFFAYDHYLFPNVSFKDFFAGVIFDLVTLAFCFFILGPWDLFPTKKRIKKWYRIIEFTLFNLVIFLSVSINLIDIEYFRHTYSRSNSSLFTMMGYGNDLKQQMPSFLNDYWYILVWIVIVQFIAIVLYKFLLKKIQDDSIKHGYFKQGIIFILGLAAIFITARGGFGLRPISPMKAAHFTSPHNTQFVLNSAFTVVSTWGQENLLEEKEYFDANELKKYFNPVHQYKNEGPLEGQNVVVILMESISTEYIGSINGTDSVCTPFLDDLVSRSYAFTHCLATGKKSMDAVPAVLSSIPKLMEFEYITSIYSSNDIESLPINLKKMGYSSAFYHGATNGSMNFDVFCDVLGFDQYYGRKEYKNDKNFDGTWGIYDDKFLSWTADQISSMKTPFFSTVFTLSSHPPYAIPEAYQEIFNDGPTDMHNAIAYADYSLQLFFEKASQTSWYDSTLFVLVADHTPASSNSNYITDYGILRVPLIFYHPTKDLKAGVLDDRIVSHVDIMPTLLDLLGYKEPFFAFGNSVFKDEGGFSACYHGNKYLYFGTYLSNQYMLTYQDEHPTGLYNLKDGTLKNNMIDSTEIVKPFESSLKAIIQTYNHALITNRMLHERIE